MTDLARINRWVDMRVDDLDLTSRTKMALKNDCIETVGDLARKTEVEMLQILHFGRRGLNETKEVLASMGMKHGQLAPVEALFTLRVWGDRTPSSELLADELERIAGMVRNGFTSGEAAMDEDYPGQGWWSGNDFNGDEA